MFESKIQYIVLHQWFQKNYNWHLRHDREQKAWQMLFISETYGLLKTIEGRSRESWQCHSNFSGCWKCSYETGLLKSGHRPTFRSGADPMGIENVETRPHYCEKVRQNKNNAWKNIFRSENTWQIMLVSYSIKRVAGLEISRGKIQDKRVQVWQFFFPWAKVK